MDCPKCSGLTDVVDSRPHEAGIRRRRRCRVCDHRFTTWETTTKPRPMQAVLLEKAKRSARDATRYANMTPEAKAELLMRQKFRRAGIASDSH